ncbi:hypothetical protein OJ997_14980 [Solirubrobacter phytolaccae]|uniref:Choice-of-anchor D domain-containing protein n=1 Tax=Solirubrobacter phytolaccae TaxID=1404360 RepID=A0A9X3SFL0_9ACTN|nr:hypothetical protein [Solirubrobacter phytolaccae]MDA0181607.1 hypothetical protein [Solirubrobacter phytolaccae]
MRYAAPLIVLLTWLFAAPASAAVVPGHVTMVSERGESIGKGAHRLYDTAEGDWVGATVADDGNAIDVFVNGGPEGDNFDLEFGAKRGEPLVPGVYTGAENFGDPAKPKIQIHGDGRACNFASGSFEVRELAIGADGTVQRAWILYEQVCEQGRQRLFGEVRIGAPAAVGPQVMPTIARFPAVDVGWGGPTVQVVAKPAAGGRIVRAELAGAAAADFVVRDDRCSGATVATGTACEVWVRFMPKSAGTRLATLRVTDAAGGTTDVPVQGFAYGGQRSFVIDSDPLGNRYAYGAEAYSDARWADVDGPRRGLNVSVIDAEDRNWNLHLTGAPLEAGRTYSGGIELYALGWCERHGGTFTVHELTYDADGVRTLDISFDHHCQDNPNGTRGRVKWRAGDTTPPAPWMVARVGATDRAAVVAGPPAPAVTAAARDVDGDGGQRARRLHRGGCGAHVRRERG